MRILHCLLPDGYIPVTYWAPHPCGGLYMEDALCWGASGSVGRWLS